MDKPKEACGVMGISSPSKSSLGKLCYLGLISLQHRGQDSAGITISTNGKLKTEKALGLVTEAFRGKDTSSWVGEVVIGHTRYSTTGEVSLVNSQPVERVFGSNTIALAHNGNLINTAELKELLKNEGEELKTSTDSEIILALITKNAHKGLVEAVTLAMNLVKGSFSLVIISGNKLIGVRDSWGIRPLCLGVLDDGSYALASESCAIDVIGGKLIRDVNPGEIIVLESNTAKKEVELSAHKYSKDKVQAPCAFESIYFSRPDSVMRGQELFQFRKECGRLLYNQSPIKADLVLGVPDSGIAAAIGVSEESGIAFSLGLIKNKYLGRSFIEPTEEMRKHLVSLKFNPLRSEIDNKRILLVDDSLVRGTTSKKLIDILRKAGAAEVHLYSASPPVKHPCFFGIDLPTKKDLIAVRLSSVEKICSKIGADSLTYLSLENLSQALGGESHCAGCFSGTYPKLD